MTTSIDEMFTSLLGHEVPGGCDDCEAVQTVRQGDAGIWHLTVHHDDHCPTLARYQRRAVRNTN